MFSVFSPRGGGGYPQSQVLYKVSGPRSFLGGTQSWLEVYPNPGQGIPLSWLWVPFLGQEYPVLAWGTPGQGYPPTRTGITPPPARTEVPPSPGLGLTPPPPPQVMLRSVCLIRFPAGGLSSFCLKFHNAHFKLALPISG